MAVWAEISASQVEYSRIDADYYHPFYLAELGHWRRLDERLGVSKLVHLIRVPVRTGRTPTSRQPKDGEVCISFIKTDTIREGSVDFLKSDVLPARVLGFRDYIPGDAVVITIIGATPEIIGRTAIVRPKDPKCVTNQNVAVVSTNEKCDDYYLTAFFQTKLGRDQLWRHSRRTEQVNLNCREVERVLVPLLSNLQQKEIGDLVRDSFNASDQSVTLYQQAQRLLESELKLDNLNFQKPMGYTARFSDLEHSLRSDAQHYQPQFGQLFDHLTAFPLRRIRGIRTYNRRGLQPSYVENGPVDVVNSQHLGPQHLDYEGLQKTSKVAFASSAEGHIRINDLLLYTTGAYIGRTNAYLCNAPALASNHVNILRLVPGIDAAYMALVFQSVIGQFQTQKHARGSAQAELYPGDIDRFVVPLLDPTKQEAIGDLVRESLERQRESKRLLEQAKSRVEQLIEEAVRS